MTMLSYPFVLSFALLLSVPVLFLVVAPRVLPTKPPPVFITLPDELEDLALFQRAASASATTATHHQQRQQVLPPPATPKIAFLFLTNSDLYFAPLWERFFQGNQRLYNIYVHADPSRHLNPPGGVFRGRFIPGKRTERSSPTLVSAARRLLAAALIDDESNAFFALVSQHCIPLHSFRFIYCSLFSPPSSRSPSNRFMSFIEILDDEPGLWARYTARGGDVMMPEVPFSSFRVGSQFFILTREHSLLVIKDRQLWRKFRLPCLRVQSCYPEEHYFPTLLNMEDPSGCHPFTLTHVNWTGSAGGHPHTYGVDEVRPSLIRRLRASNATGFSNFFARKFSPDCINPLLKLADSFIFQD
ncbi:hypothetical protein EJ110_NYTH47085 [Nymphaea thermarum]|nr:hypothetical protein EJ110_NYTH47085 [Nymphaea thermarum]